MCTWKKLILCIIFCVSNVVPAQATGMFKHAIEGKKKKEVVRIKAKSPGLPTPRIPLHPGARPIPYEPVVLAYNSTQKAQARTAEELAEDTRAEAIYKVLKQWEAAWNTAHIPQYVGCYAPLAQQGKNHGQSQIYDAKREAWEHSFPPAMSLGEMDIRSTPSEAVVEVIVELDPAKAKRVAVPESSAQKAVAQGSTEQFSAAVPYAARTPAVATGSQADVAEDAYEQLKGSKATLSIVTLRFIPVDGVWRIVYEEWEALP